MALSLDGARMFCIRISASVLGCEVGGSGIGNKKSLENLRKMVVFYGILWDLPSGKLLHNYGKWLKIVDFSINSMVDLSTVMLNYQRVSNVTKTAHQTWQLGNPQKK